MSYRTIDGSVLQVEVEFFDEDDNPIIVAPGYPIAQFLDSDKQVLSQIVATPTLTPGNWSAALTMPLLGISATQEYKVRWRCKSIDGEKFQTVESVLVDPKVETRDSDIVVMSTDEDAEFVLPFKYTVSTTATYQVFNMNNEVLAAASLDAMEMDISHETTRVVIPVVPMDPSLIASLFVVRARINGRTKSFNYKYWSITPQISLAATMVEEFLNKSRIENVIPELRYTDGDLIGYLERGLYLFNMTGQVTQFNGLNMQGVLLDGWVTCSCYYALAAQLLAEGSLAFDFSGQGISLNVDRTPALEGALGRIESKISDTIVPLKKHLAVQGLISGDGSIGNSALRNSYSIGVLGLTNAPTTRIRGLSLRGVAAFQR